MSVDTKTTVRSNDDDIKNCKVKGDINKQQINIWSMFYVTFSGRKRQAQRQVFVAEGPVYSGIRLGEY